MEYVLINFWLRPKFLFWAHARDVINLFLVRKRRDLQFQREATSAILDPLYRRRRAQNTMEPVRIVYISPIGDAEQKRARATEKNNSTFQTIF